MAIVNEASLAESRSSSGARQQPHACKLSEAHLFEQVVVRAEYLARWTQVALGDDPATRFKYAPTSGRYANYFFKDGFDVEVEVPVGRVQLLARFDGLRRAGNVLASSSLRSRSAVLRYTLAASIRMDSSLRLKTSLERYDFSDFDDEVAAHLGLAGPF